MNQSIRTRNPKTGSDDQGLKEAMDYYRKAQAEHVTDLVQEERLSRSRSRSRRRRNKMYAGVVGIL